jgi:hypothetical protein
VRYRYSRLGGARRYSRKDGIRHTPSAGRRGAVYCIYLPSSASVRKRCLSVSQAIQPQPDRASGDSRIRDPPGSWIGGRAMWRGGSLLAVFWSRQRRAYDTLDRPPPRRGFRAELNIQDTNKPYRRYRQTLAGIARIRGYRTLDSGRVVRFRARARARARRRLVRSCSYRLVGHIDVP